MSDFVTDLADLPPEKTDATPLPGTANPTQWIAAADYNALRRACYSLRGKVLGTASVNNFAAVIGDSNGAGVVPISSSVVEFGINDPDPAIHYNAIYGLASNEPVAMVDMGTGALRPHLDSGSTNAAFDLSLGKTLIANGDWWLTKFAISGTKLADWIPASSYGVTTFGVNLYTAWKNMVKGAIVVAVA